MSVDPPDGAPGTEQGDEPERQPDTASDPRRDELARGLSRTRERIAAAARAAGRDPEGVTLVVVTKDHPAADLRRLVELGVSDVGEARQQQLRDKHSELGDLAARLTWHAIGRLQRNKARAVGRLADAVHSVDDPRLLPLLAAGADEAGRRIDCLVQVNLEEAVGEVPGRGGVPAADVDPLAAAVAAHEGLVLRGVMAVAPLDADPDEAFARLAAVADRVRSAHPGATWLSAGMSGDLESAIAHGATHVRVGTAILGSRQPAR